MSLLGWSGVPSVVPGLDALLGRAADVYRPAVGGRDNDARIHCGNAACGDPWRNRWKDRRRPVFEGQWGCSRGCLERIVAQALRREGRAVSDAFRGERAVHAHRIPLGLVLLAQGWITHPQLQRALETQRRSGAGRIGGWLMDGCGLREECVTRALSVQWSCPVLSSAGFEPAAMALAMPRMLVEELGLVPLRVVGGTMQVGFRDCMDASASFALERVSGLRVESGLVDASELESARRRLLACEFAESDSAEVGDEGDVGAAVVRALVKYQPRSSRLVRVHHLYWLRMSLEGEGAGLPGGRGEVVDRVYSMGGHHA